jgi:hypothetical protein
MEQITLFRELRDKYCFVIGNLFAYTATDTNIRVDDMRFLNLPGNCIHWAVMGA